MLDHGSSRDPRFRTTRWSLILRARRERPDEARDALGELCATYWYPVYAFIRHQGPTADEALDLTQEFFRLFLKRRDYAKVDRSRGRFRSYLLKSCVRFLMKERARSSRRVEAAAVPIDAGDAERRYQYEPASGLSAVQVFERRWALTVLDRALGRVRSSYENRGRGPLFEALLPILEPGSARGRSAEIADRLGMTAGAVQVAAHRLRTRYRDAIREVIAETLDDPVGVDDELHDLFAALRAAGPEPTGSGLA